MNNALIGHTGFVGGNLLQQGHFAATFNSRNITEIENARFDTVWCAGVRAVKWWANLHPQEDWQAIEPLLKLLETVRCGHFVLISTVDVFQNSCGKTELSVPDEAGLHPYGLHRLAVENAVRECFPRHTIVRLPGLFGEGLKKNIIYDFLHNNQLDTIHSDSRFQFYDLASVHQDCLTAVNAGLELVHFDVLPCSVADVAQTMFGRPFAQRPKGATPVIYDLHTVHSGHYNARIPYLQDRAEVLRRLASFAQRESENA